MMLYVLAGSPSWLAPPQSNVLGRSDGVVPKSQGKVMLVVDLYCVVVAGHPFPRDY
ncbi:hypothetical protein CMEL01_16439 [Colletotrichum melonis]|uniref:Uncharacterized protein n=1 Tax=Colletotrichum melonis TaxID=1209925 RepID=A0AAI9XMV8_9PEZI|nr:hypothetical protein CMEL01_16439 [Colletotrichum melonis]